MTPRDRVLTALRHEQPDRVPLFYRDVPDVGERLREELGLADREELLQYFEIDFRWVEPVYTGPPLRDNRTGRVKNVWGVEFERIKLERGGYDRVVQYPLGDVEDLAALDDYPWPELQWFDFSVVPRQLETYRDYATMTAPGVASPGVLTPIQDLVGIERAWTDMLVNTDFYCALVERVIEFNLAFINKLFTAADGRIDFFRIGDDFGTQKSLLMSVEHWQKYVEPSIRRMVRAAKKFGAHYYHHSCGAVRPLIPLMIDTGLDVLDPIQVKAKGMVPAELKAQFGDRLCFSGGVDEQELLCRGSPQEVREGVFQLLDDMAHGGGFFLGPTHNLQGDIPTDNILAMYGAARHWRP